MIMQIPEKGVSKDVIMQELRQMKSLDFDWRAGRVPSYTYFVDDETLDIQREAYGEYIAENGLGAGRAFKSLERMTDDIKSMSKALFNAPSGAGASFTSGGTESVFMAVKTARDLTRHKRGEHGGRFNIVACETAHPCLDKAGQLLGVDVKRTPHNAEFRADPESLRAAIDDRTMMLFASAPNYPFGTFDPIHKVSALAQEKGLRLHVDGCWGGFLSPFAERLGYPIPEWDFRVPGVSSLSADIHKFGYAAKGASVVLYRDAEDQEFERFSFSGWPRGTYATPTFLGTKAGGAVASAWAVMQYLGMEGYLRAAKLTMDATMQLIDGLNAIPEIYCLTPNGESNLISFACRDPGVDIYAVADRLEERGWLRGRMRDPQAIQQGVNPAHLAVVPEYLEAVREAINHVKARNSARVAYDEHSY
ncbi:MULTISPECIES: aminotransferase class V-fold PLP-dependent enzyme [unclassified Mesorhizobium]|uniref:pyridoxal phosphate-dependent decarboxylase family protein n=1 Tax=unclassified Mesorhizobium TaxID=325217 RepID=UPI000BB0A340|nr:MULTISPECIES: aminotransferase class V-fold PLP-dependent enzyme [unclassified Mesorhizobium]AZO07890.1 aspartate aminotransferase family protein [Mesorhizobium sp. M3A.F.Ca.ET.080.04.2.1]PBB86882.1 aspartate aminotransferase family protein [Mesorhizobium sp. WSM3876]RWF22045.1 MAG: aspartate aminotransferase family protein [Mesorhizobium sp.]